MNKTAKRITYTLIILLIISTLYKNILNEITPVVEMPYSTFIKNVEAKKVQKVVMEDEYLFGSMIDGGKIVAFKTIYPQNDNTLVERLLKNNVSLEVREPMKAPFWLSALVNWFPIILLVLFWIYLLKGINGGGKAMSFGRSRAKLIENEAKVTFEDVAGCDEAKEELQEIIEFLKEPEKFTKLGARIPRGVLLVGRPGTGKTLLARAVSGEAGVPFFYISGSDFVEMFVGVGASRVRDLFEQARKKAPCIIFIDEIDAVGRQRGAGLGGGHDEREQTLNQLLVEMDGFDNTKGIIIMAATNRPDVLDPALLRPGRFDRQIVVPLPDLKGREEILKVHVRKIPLEEGVDLKLIARGTPYFSGADLANLVNEAALLAARRDKKSVGLKEFEEARDKVMMGPERKNRVIGEKEKRITAYHESGHALLAKLIPEVDPLHKVTIIPRGMAGGLTQLLPEEEKMYFSRSHLLAQIKVTMGGRIAEEITFDEITTGAGHDMKSATELARKMVCQWGMSDVMGPITYGEQEEHLFLGRELVRHSNYSEKTAQLIDEEIKRIVMTCYREAKKMLEENKDKLIKLAEELMEKEVLTGEEVDRLLFPERVKEKEEEKEKENLKSNQIVENKEEVKDGKKESSEEAENVDNEIDKNNNAEDSELKKEDEELSSKKLYGKSDEGDDELNV